MNLDEFRASIEGGEDALYFGVHALRPEITTYPDAVSFVRLLVARLLAANRYGAAALILWGPRVFNPHPESVKRIWTAINKYHKVILIGASSMGKSYCPIVYLLLDWLRDPEGTSVKIISTSEGHARANTFSTLTELYRSTIIPCPGTQIDKFIGIDSKEQDRGIALVSIPAGDTGKGRLRGFHPKPRAQRHPELGDMTRVRAFLDECEEIPYGVWDGVDNLCSNIDPSGTIKVICATNPKDPLSILAEQAEPRTGWANVDIDTDLEWESRERYHVVRVDAARSENVQQRRIVFPGLMSFEGFENLRLKADGQSAEYFCFARGIYSRSGTTRSLIPLSLLDHARGSFVFSRTVTNCGSVDLAFEGGDSVVFASGRFGLADGWLPLGSQKIIYFAKPAYCCELLSIYELPAKMTVAQAHAIRDECRRLNIPGNWFACDATGPGQGVADGLREMWDPGIRCINWAEAATDSKIFVEDKRVAREDYVDVVSEMWFALRRWLESGYFLISPHVVTSRLFSELSKREYRLGPKGPGDAGVGRLLVESKREFKLRNKGKSPDFADAAIMLLHGARLNAEQKAFMPGLTRAPERRKPVKRGPSPWGGEQSRVVIHEN